GLTTCCISSQASEEGIGKYFIKYMNLKNYVIGLIICFIIAVALNLGPGIHIGLLGIIGGAFGGALIALLAKKHLKIANGDVLGASNELGRLFSLIAMLVLISINFSALI
ncbi:MAG: adenosylcobinamide-GDP ribazoletransferase, partial [Methanobrevibacter sp.]|nr:adenosylcobinamide-GDP ribazoletransferase [Methanobrevibacter sp.]